LVRCDDRPGLVAAVTTFLAKSGANIISLDQHSTQQTGGIFMQRTIFHLPGLAAARGELERDFADLADQVRPFGVPFIHVPAGKDIREQAEERQLELLRGNVDLVVLARYMQILSPRFLTEVSCPMINIHHSFLPAFIGAAPYRRAKERGVKLVGATAHYVTEDLDEGPIIEQDVVRVDHRHSIEDLVRLGADVERAVLSRAVQWHCEDRVIRFGNQTVVF
jgi:formyltetrahydrofolate deformylase